MRLKIKKLLRGGEYFVFFESMGFSPEEAKRIKKFGIPTVDLSAVGLGAHELDEIRLSIRCHSAEEAAQITNRIKQSIKDKLAELSAQAAAFAAEQAVKISLRGKMLVLGSACALALILLAAYKGFVWLRQEAVLKGPPSAPARVTVTEDTITIADTLAFLEADRESPQEPAPTFEKQESEDAKSPAHAESPSREESQEPPPDPATSYQKDESEDDAAPAFVEDPSGEASSDSQAVVKPDFAPTIMDTAVLGEVSQEPPPDPATSFQRDESEDAVPAAHVESPSKEASSDSQALVQPDFTATVTDTEVFSEESQEPPPDPATSYQKDESEDAMPPAYAESPSGEASSDSQAVVKPDFTPTLTDTKILSEQSQEPTPGPATDHQKDEREDAMPPAYAESPSKEASSDSQAVVKPDFTPTVTDTEVSSEESQETQPGPLASHQEDESGGTVTPASDKGPSTEAHSDSEALTKPDLAPTATDAEVFSEESQEPPPGPLASDQKDQSEDGLTPASDKDPSTEADSDSEALAKPDVAPTTAHTEVLSEESQEPLPDPQASYQKEESEDNVVLAYAKSPSKEASLDSRPLVKPDFTLTAVPETLVRYSDLEAELAESGAKANRNRFDLIVTPWGGFKGPVTLEVSGSSPLIEEHLSAREIETLPGVSSLRISLSPESPPEIRASITVTARGKTPSGDVITHQKRLVAIFRQSLPTQGRVWRVSTQGSDLSGDGGAGSPFRTIQKGIDHARAGDTVLVERGRYEENIGVSNKDWMLIASHFIFDLDETTVESTIIEPEEPGWAISIGGSEQVTVRGFTIQKGRGEKDSHGGGIYCYDSSPNILDNIVTENENHSGYGAGICCYGCAPTILRNQITENRNYDGRGAGIYCYKSDPDIQHNTIGGNYSSGGGSGIHLLEPNWVRIVRNVIHGDSGFSAIVLYNTGTTGDFQVVNNTISNNRANAVGYFGGPWSFQNNIITHNDGYGLFTFEGIAYFMHNDVWGNVSGNDTIDYYGLEESPIGDNGNISENPYFGDPAYGNFHLSFNSPCIDLGDPNHPVPPHGGRRIDMGAIEYICPDATCGDVNRDCFIDGGDVEYLEDYVSSNGPAPHPLWIGDVDGDASVTMGDVIYLQKYINGTGPAPCGGKDRD